MRKRVVIIGLILGGRARTTLNKNLWWFLVGVCIAYGVCICVPNIFRGVAHWSDYAVLVSVVVTIYAGIKADKAVEVDPK